MAAVLMVQEKKADEFGPEPKPEEVEDAREVSLMKNHRCDRGIPRRATKVVLKAVNGMMGEELGMTAAGAGGDEKDELDDDGL